MIRLIVLVVALASYVHSDDFKCITGTPCAKSDGAIECSGDCGCGDSTADECSRPHPTTAVHVDTIDDCMANCQVFALEGRCKFIIFHYDNIDENCIIMNDEFDSYTAHCNVHAQALWGPTANEGLARWTGCVDDKTCPNDVIQGNCNKCTDCNMDSCRGFMLSDCEVHSLPLETADMASWDNCEAWARVRGQGTVARFSREQSHCELYGGVWDYDNFIENGFNRVCKVAMVELGTPTTCTDPGCPLPCQSLDTAGVCSPSCCSHSDCQAPDTPICNAQGVCVAGCIEMADCAGATVTCKEPWAMDPDNCEYCGNIDPADGIGECLPGCDNNHNLCPAEYPTCDASNHHCHSVGQEVIQKIRLKTGTCDGCDNNKEGGAVVSVWGKKGLNCTTGQLDRINVADYGNGQTTEFQSGIDISQMGGCNNAAIRPDSATITWTGVGTWTPSDVTLLDNNDYENNCQLPGTGLTNGQSFTVKCSQEK